MNDDGEVEALRSLVRLPWITQQHFVGMLQARRIDSMFISFSNGNGFMVQDIITDHLL